MNLTAAILVASCATFGSSEPPTIKWSLGAVMRTRKTEMHFYPIGTDKLDLLPSYGDITAGDVKNKKWQINQVKVGIGNGMFPVCPLVGEIPESGRLRVVVIGKTIHPGSSVTDLEGSAEMSLSSPSSDNAFECELHVESYDSCEDNKSFSDRLGDSFRQRKSKDADIARITEVDVQSDVQIHVLLIEIEVAQETGFFFPNRTPSKRQKQSASPKSPPSRGSVIADHSESSAEPIERLQSIPQIEAGSSTLVPTRVRAWLKKQVPFSMSSTNCRIQKISKSFMSRFKNSEPENASSGSLNPPPQCRFDHTRRRVYVICEVNSTSDRGSSELAIIGRSKGAQAAYRAQVADRLCQI